VTGWVVCASCGTRIKAGRGHCLRCLAELPEAGVPAQTTIWESLGLSQRDGMILAVVVAAVVLTLVAIFSFTQEDAMDDVARPVDVAATAGAVAKPAVVPAPDDSQGVSPEVAATTTPAYEPAAFLDSTRGGGTAFTSGDFASARLAYERALFQQPDDPETLNNLGQVLVRLRRVDEAVVRFERAVALVPGKSTYHFNLAHALAQNGNLDRAIVEYRQAAKLFPADYAAQYNLAMSLHKKGDEQAAIAEFQRAISLAPGDASFHLSLAISLEKVGRIADAVREYRTSLQMDRAAPGADQLKAHVEALSALPAKTPSVP
jgi:Flp pilus assembly protein TadD